MPEFPVHPCVGLYNTRPPGLIQVPGGTHRAVLICNIHRKSHNLPELLSIVTLTPHCVLKHLPIIRHYGVHKESPGQVWQHLEY